MSKRIKSFKTGDLILLSTGSYSDYCITLVGLALKEFDIEDEVTSFKLQLEVPADDDMPVQYIDLFRKWIIDKKLISDIPCRDINLGEYNDLELNEGW